jgi:hypothetical protein
MCWTPCWLGIRRKESREIDGGRRHKVGWGKFATGISCKIVEWRATADEDGHYCFAVAL